MHNNALIFSKDLLKVDPNRITKKWFFSLARNGFPLTDEILDKFHNIDITDTADNNNKTALHYSCRKGNFQNIESLLKRGADINQIDKEGYTPFYHFFLYLNMTTLDKYENKENIKKIYEILLRNGAKYHKPTLSNERGVVKRAIEIIEFALDKKDSSHTLSQIKHRK